MIKYDREEWLLSLKEGDLVALESGSWGYKNFNLQRISKITPTRRFNLDNGRKFDNNGFLMGHKDQWTSRPAIRPYDQYVKDHLEREALLLTISRMNTKDLHLDQLRAIVKVLEA
jgi:hypothetical protein